MTTFKQGQKVRVVQVEVGQVRRGPSGTRYRVIAFHGGYASLIDHDDPGELQRVGENVWIGDMEFSASRATVAGWELA